MTSDKASMRVLLFSASEETLLNGPRKYFLLFLLANILLLYKGITKRVMIFPALIVPKNLEEKDE